MTFRDLINLADALGGLKADSLYTSLALFKELVRLTLRYEFSFHFMSILILQSQMSEGMDQRRRHTYIAGCFSEIRSKLAQNKDIKKSQRWSFSDIALFDVVLTVFRSRLTALDDLGMVKTIDLQALCAELKASLLIQLGVSLAEEFSPRKKERKSLLLLCTIDALTSLGVTSSDLADFKDAATSFATCPENVTFDVAKRLEVFVSIQGGGVGKKSFGTRVKGDLTTLYGRQAILAKVQAATLGKNEKSKLNLLDSIFGVGLVGLTQTDKLLAAKQVIMLCEGQLYSLVPNPQC